MGGALSLSLSLSLFVFLSLSLSFSHRGVAKAVSNTLQASLKIDINNFLARCVCHTISSQAVVNLQFRWLSSKTQSR